MTGVDWRTSGYDGVAHAFEALGEAFSEALCTHSAPNARLSVPAVDDRRCVACILIFGDMIAEASPPGGGLWTP